ncbi:MAG: hypothetical protein U1E66_13600 [Rhodospirillales bacterium]
MSVAVLAGLAAVSSGPAHAAKITFKMVPSTASVSAGCLATATADVTVQSLGEVERMTVNARNLPPNTDSICL